MLNASPDLPQQLETLPRVGPSSKRQPRFSPIEAVLLTNADLDHTLGLFSLREGGRVRIHASDTVRQALAEGIGVQRVLENFCGVDWVTPPGQANPLLFRDGGDSGLEYRAVPLTWNAPPKYFHSSAPTSGAGPDSLGYWFRDRRTGGRLLFLPDVAEATESLRAVMTDCDLLLFDGTFWSETEMAGVGSSKERQARMGHLPISGEGGSLRILTGLAVPEKIYVHLNNTNPVLIEDSEERAEVEAAGVRVGADGMAFSI